MSESENRENSLDLIDQYSVRQIIQMFDLMPDILFWVKNADGQIVYGNAYFLEHIGVQNLSQAIGCTDYDFSPPHIARQFSVDDQKVMAGEIVNNRLEMNITQTGEMAWFTTSKRPLLDSEGKAIGSYGVSRHLEKTSLSLSGMDALKIPVDFIRSNYMNEISLENLADISHLSISALERRFKKHLGKTPKRFINEVRLENARRLLVETTQSVASVANAVGFTDHSYFSKQFNGLFGQLPSALRKSHMRAEMKPS
ncbi:AraC family transcriptional regulator [Pseudoteredinibacter isoporae]|uniref:AraC-like DNA-binding protein n=1 Tax=Pseudoteredinibacter isoporae TaxID=570281 RepID=A0A7X0JVK3_9GAMM|nr:AraC family transcriptional regulator [Pseudoteredinibacter isoporae]MBB6522548.1 AraC-like DNA-binding protein [Pseudoteredinibacter isoporae]NHO88078.1 AraC family transcriptional regulator [Pseudoteredinibacter isoporae]NIB23591.1 AraC family transcriptional regulator [Pseudoteredinibacter isoporae]